MYSTVLFAARSTKGITRLSPTERAAIKLPDEVKEVLIGILLGDAHIVRRTPTANSRLVYAQTAVKHKEYFDYVFSFFLPFCVNDYKPQSSPSPLVINEKKIEGFRCAFEFLLF